MKNLTTLRLLQKLLQNKENLVDMNVKEYWKMPS